MIYIYTTADGKSYSAEDGTLLIVGDGILLITNRTAEDVERWRVLRNKGWSALTDEEKAEWLSSLKGSYNYLDMNRVESFVRYLTDRLNANGYLFHPITKSDWQVSDLPTKADIDRYFGNVARIRELLAVYETTPLAPTTSKKFDYHDANNLEQILVDVEDLIVKIEQSWFYSNDVFCGEV